MFPIRDNNPISTKPYLTIGLIAINAAIFLFQVARPAGETSTFTWKFGFVPAELVESPPDLAEGVRDATTRYEVGPRGRVLIDPRTGQPRAHFDRQALEVVDDVPASINLFTSMFLHGGWMHLIGNMFFLWIFGNNVEDRLGHLLYIIFYVAGGVCGNLLHAFFSPGYIPLVGASGAISALMGGYLLLYPHARIFAIVPIGWYPATFSLPAWIYMGFYIVLQNFVPAFSGSESNVAYWAHIGGFVSGMAMMLVLPKRKAAAPPPVYDPRHDDADFVL